MKKITDALYWVAIILLAISITSIAVWNVSQPTENSTPQGGEIIFQIDDSFYVYKIEDINRGLDKVCYLAVSSRDSDLICP